MCYHASTPGKLLLKELYPDKIITYDNDIYYLVSGFSRPFLPVTLNTKVDVIQPARWKLIPFWVKTEAEAQKYANTLNAKSEEVFEKASYKNAITKYRGLLYINGFFEPHASDGVKNDQSYYVQAPGYSVFTLGIVWSPWQDYNTFSIITTPANPVMEEVHNVGKRMPLIIPEYRRDAWLFANGRYEIESLMVPYEGELSAHRTARVTGTRGIDPNTPGVQDAL